MELTTHVPRILIFVQGKDQDINGFNEDLNKWLDSNKFYPQLTQMVCANDGRLTVAFEWSEEVLTKKGKEGSS